MSLIEDGLRRLDVVARARFYQDMVGIREVEHAKEIYAGTKREIIYYSIDI